MSKIKVHLSNTEKWRDALNQGARYFVIDENESGVKFYDKEDKEICLKENKKE